MRYSEEEIKLIEENLLLGCTYKEIADFIFEDFGIIRAARTINAKANSLGLKSLNSKLKTQNQFISEMKIINSNILILGEYINDNTKIKVKD